MQRHGCWSLILLATTVIGGIQAQVDTGVITGRISDPTGAVTPNVQISVVQPTTSFRFQAVSNAERHLPRTVAPARRL
jgi:hypothetical protein